ncbi:hypothetical protein HPB48_021790 [Haemaphysalis longicornis]|uniref:Uncharacterized protein n=1 Tax=Haemaphysalis longicornis TaxID=44386 RepID=A0A9J6GCG6_HAELO|nr:hypothetical protein HPB48_021790 [Haemaphysalis longicornis]
MANPVKTSSDTVGLRKVYDYVLVNKRGIEILGLKKSSFSSMLGDIFLRALPHEIVVQYHRTCAAQVSAQRTDASQEKTDLDRLLTFLGMELESLEKSNFKTTKGHEDIPGHNASISVTTMRHRPYCTNHSNKTAESCAFCKYTQHLAEICRADISLQQKKQLLAKGMRCFRCI